MKHYIYLCCILSLGITHNAMASKCLTDIASVGMSLDSVVYQADKANSNAKLASTTAMGLKAGWIMFCPKQKIEYETYFRLRKYNFADNDRVEGYSSFPEDINLLSLGLEGRLNKPRYRLEIPLDLELRQEMSFNADNGLLQKVEYTNLKIMSGIRKYFLKKKKYDLTAVVKLGALASFDSKAKTGYVYGLSGEYFYRLKPGISLKLDFYYDTYRQSYEELAMIRQELGLRTNLFFRF